MASDPTKRGLALKAEAEKLLEEGSSGFLEKAKEAYDCLEGKGDKEESGALGLLATAYLQADQLSLAMTCVKQATEIFKKLGDKVGEADMLYVTTIVKINQGAASVRENVFKALQEVQEAYVAAGSKIGEVKVICDMITYYLGRKEKAEAEELKKKVLGMGLPKKEQALATKKVGSAYFSMKETEESLTLVKDAIKAFKDAGDKDGEESTMKTLINMHLTKKEIGEALAVCDQMVGALSGAKKAAAMKFMSQIHLEQEDGGFQAAIGDLNKARTLYKEAGDKEGEAEALQGVAELHFQIGDNDEANKAAKEAMSVCKLPGALGTVAQIQLFAGDIAGAMETAAEMLTLATASGSKSGEAGAKLATANAVFSMDPTSTEGVSNAKDALLLFSGLGDIYGMQSALHTLANAFFAKGDLEEGLKCAKEALAYFRQTGDAGNEELLKQTIEEARWSIAELRKQAPKKPMAVGASSQTTGAETSPITESQVPSDLLDLATAGRKYWGVPKQVAADPTVDAIERAPSHAIIWAANMTDNIATQTCVEFGDLVGTMAKGDVAKIPIVITTQGVNARMTGEMVPPHITGVSGVTMWGMARTVRQEIPQVQIMLLDFSAALTSAQIPRMLRPPFPMVNESAYYHRARWEPQIAAVPSLFRRELKRDNLTGGGGGVAYGDPKKASKFMRKSFSWTGPSHKLDYCWYRQEWRAVGPAEGDVGPMPPPPPCRAVRSS